MSRWLTMATWLIWFGVYWGVGTRSYFANVSHSSQLDRISMLMMAAGALGLFGSMVLVLLAIVTLPQNKLVVLLGTALACGGITGSFYCRHVLGRFWSAPTTLQENHKIIDKGPYGIVGHRIYTVTLGFCLRTTLAFSAWWTWALLTLLLVGYVLKALDEERFLGRASHDHRVARLVDDPDEKTRIWNARLFDCDLGGVLARGAGVEGLRFAADHPTPS